MKRLNIRVEGRVQGVFFRASAKTMADDLGLFGWCRNEPDGSVYVEVEGEENSLSSFLKWCKQGPQFATVSEVMSEEDSIAGYSEFEIRRH